MDRHYVKNRLGRVSSKTIFTVHGSWFSIGDSRSLKSRARDSVYQLEPEHNFH